jgi:protein-S-isoprenylcysteine O-methyltransferase Ste14
MKKLFGIDIQKLVSPILMWGIVFFGIIIVYIAFGGLEKGLDVLASIEFFPQDSYVRLLVLPAFIYWIYFFSGAIRVHSEAIRSVEGVTKIIKTGVYGIVRHPIYAGDIVLSWGIFLYLPNPAILLIVIWLNSVLFLWMKLEEKLLIEKFAKDYLDYRKEVPMFFPRIKKLIRRP